MFLRKGENISTVNYFLGSLPPLQFWSLLEATFLCFLKVAYWLFLTPSPAKPALRQHHSPGGAVFPLQWLRRGASPLPRALLERSQRREGTGPRPPGHRCHGWNQLPPRHGQAHAGTLRWQLPTKPLALSWWRQNLYSLGCRKKYPNHYSCNCYRLTRDVTVFRSFTWVRADLSMGLLHWIFDIYCCRRTEDCTMQFWSDSYLQYLSVWECHPLWSEQMFFGN